MTKRQFDDAVDLLRQGLEPASEIQGRIFVAVGHIIKHQRGIPEEVQWPITSTDVAEYLASLDGVYHERKRLKRVAELLIAETLPSMPGSNSMM
jgi:hypothetical protein